MLQVISTPPFAWETGGCARVVYDLSRHLAERGNEINILTTDMYKPNQRYCLTDNKEDGLNIIRFKNISNSLAWKYKLYLSPGMIKYLKNNLNCYDVVHLQDLISGAAIATARYCKKYKIPYVLTSHGSLPWLMEENIQNRFFSLLGGRKILDNASKVIALNKTEKESFEKLNVPPEKIEVIPNGVDLSIYSKLPKKGEFKKKYGVAEYEKIILYLGRIHKSKGINMLVESFLSIKNRLNNVKLVIVGPDDGFLDVLIKQIHYSDIAGDVIFTGPLHGLNKIEAYVDADLFVTPSFSGFPLTFLESCICGTPIITTNKIEELDWINGNVGFVVGYSSDQISEIILKILDDDGLLSKLSINSVCFVKENFGWDKISESVERLYYEVL
ncbi:MAG: hypothetical protein CVV29_00340 [Methanobacteriales archaeon HGW-Methanobacteriales-2]|nr:MAG: hypothetical protein CVV29_00340 [Methanobacteriales archaeon HGW-Methanobacteriales-2]